jgi:hypothetical protein
MRGSYLLATALATGVLSVGSVTQAAPLVLSDSFSTDNTTDLNLDLTSRQSGTAAPITWSGTQNSPSGTVDIRNNFLRTQLHKNSADPAQGVVSGTASLDSSLPLDGELWSFSGTYRMANAGPNPTTGSAAVTFGDATASAADDAAADIGIRVNKDASFDVFADGSQVVSNTPLNLPSGVTGNLYGEFYFIDMTVDESTGDVTGTINVGGEATPMSFSADFESTDRMFAHNVEADMSNVASDRTSIHVGQLLDMEASIVPEPTSLALLGLGGLAMFGRKRRRA